MKKIILIIFIFIAISTCYGFYIKSTGNELQGDQIIGISVLAVSFILMPLFIYYRSKGKKFKDYMLTHENLEKMRKNKSQSTDNE
jgi:uncharacterized protein YxeA